MAVTSKLKDLAASVELVSSLIEEASNETLFHTLDLAFKADAELDGYNSKQLLEACEHIQKAWSALRTCNVLVPPASVVVEE